MLTFHRKYFFLTLFLFFVEVMIALYVKDRFIRPYVGDFLVVMLMYCAVRSVLKIPPLLIAAGVLLFAYLIELLQYFRIVEVLGLQNNTVARTVIGYGFEWLDIIAYTLGAFTIILLERPHLKKNVSVKISEENP
ncbi:MAG: ribosomal maturation YjgA family protein [Flavisolibacter sp.]